MPKIKHAYNVTIKIGSEAVMDDREQKQIDAHSGIGRKGGDKPGNNGWGNGGNDGGDKGGEYR
jgi:hypothetical protein